MIIEKLKKLGFSESEAKVYVELLKNPGLNGTQLSKSLNIPRTNAYEALNSLLSKEIIQLIPDNTDKKNYIPEEPMKITKRIKDEYFEILNEIDLELQKIYVPDNFGKVYNIYGLNEIYYKLKNMLEGSKEKSYLSGKIDIDLSVDKRIKEENEDELVLIVDNKEILVANLNLDYPIAIYTNNSIILKKYLKEF